MEKHLKNAMQATEAYHNELLARLEKGEAPESIAMDKARFVDSLIMLAEFFDRSIVAAKRFHHALPDDGFFHCAIEVDEVFL